MIRERSKRVDGEALPPHAPEAERSVLGCILLDPARAHACVKQVIERTGGEQVFYDGRHQLVWGVFKELLATDVAIDLVTVVQFLADRRQLDQVGGAMFLGALADGVPAVDNLPAYLEIVWQKFLARDRLAIDASIALAVRERNGLDEVTVARQKRLQEEWELKSQRGTGVAPKYLQRPAVFAEGAFKMLFRNPMQGDPGLDLPIPIKFRIRRKETTLVSADDGAGKSTLLSYFALHLAAQDPGACIASFEESPENSLWRLASQLLGRKHLPDTEAQQIKASKAMAWLNQRFWFYNFLGISDWRDVLDAFRYTAEKHGTWLFILDSVMRIGIPDDDYAQQGTAAAAFAQFAMDFNAHLFFVIHENKGDGKGKAKVRGSKLWTANANNVTTVERNVNKGEKSWVVLSKIENEKQQKKPVWDDVKELEKELEVLKREWDTRFVLRKQRLMGTQQNGGRRFWYDDESAQFRVRWEDTATNWLDQWGASARPPAPTAARDQQQGPVGGEDTW